MGNDGHATLRTYVRLMSPAEGQKLNIEDGVSYSKNEDYKLGVFLSLFAIFLS